MAVSTIPVPFSSDWVEEVIASRPYGNLYGYANRKLKIGVIYWAGNATATTAGSTESYNVPSTFRPTREFVVPMKDSTSGGYISITTELKVNLKFMGTAWSAATLVYPLA